ncbi:MAG: nitroreductase family protein [Gemmatimonadota bacterium]
MTDDHFRPLHEYRRYPVEEMRRRVRAFRDEMERRRTVRHYADEPVPREIVEEAIRAAGRAPSGANMQPWHFAVVGDDGVKRRIREEAEREERKFYEERATDEWLEALEPLGTGPEKPFLETAPWLIAVFAESYGVTDQGEERKHYYVQESVGIATGILITALHHAGLATLTHTPSPMGFLADVLDRPENERPFLLLVTGYPAEDARVPEIDKKPLEEIATFF